MCAHTPLCSPEHIAVPMNLRGNRVLLELLHVNKLRILLCFSEFYVLFLLSWLTCLAINFPAIEVCGKYERIPKEFFWQQENFVFQPAFVHCHHYLHVPRFTYENNYSSFQEVCF